ncbi:flagellar basal body P-ring formation protein FlgA [Permianibacter sp. IMCC34836]|uniref:flagellar basal body P-ring formation chaperone FlgA n=1 Tax=Permianibacter fluminis TaxID=2738515 RepID=UPI0015553298|nr:flagellar basal body P-ring formation chaperone FlgA [Permianibacter fluminis]NQD38075.1 flagellar basal body P-ring formation protein FlgA [Permianibacter fluminis]
MKLRNAFSLLAFLVICTAQADVAPVLKTFPADVTSLQQTARQFLAGKLPPATAEDEREITLAEPDARLQLAACAQPLEGFWPANARQSGSTVVGVRCVGTPGWQVFLPVRIQEWVTVVVASRPLRPGERLLAADLQLQRVSRDQLRGNPYRDPAALVGSVTRQAIAAGQTLSDQQTCQVCKGDSVDISAADSGFKVVVKGVAEGWGNSGDRIPVRNLGSRRTIRAEVVTAGQVRVSL